MRPAATGLEASNSRDVVRLVHEGNVRATQVLSPAAVDQTLQAAAA